MLEKDIKDFLQKNNLKQADIYTKLDISKQNFYKAIRTKNFENPSLQKILDFLGLEIIISLKETNENSKNNKLYSTGKS